MNNKKKIRGVKLLNHRCIVILWQERMMTINSSQVLNPMQRKVHSTTIAKYLLPVAFNMAPPTPTKIRKKGNRESTLIFLLYQYLFLTRL